MPAAPGGDWPRRVGVGCAGLASLAAYAVGTLCVLLAIFIVPGDTSAFSGTAIHIDKGHGLGFWISLTVIVAGLVLSLMRLQQTGGRLPGALSGLPDIGGGRRQGQTPSSPG